MAIYKDFLGLNYCIYEPILDDPGAEGGNTLGYSFSSPLKYSDPIGGANPNITEIVAHSEGRTMVLLNLHRNGPFGYPTWKQVRVSDNHLTRAQRRRNIFTYTEEPGAILGNKQARFGETRTFTEPVVVDSYKPLSLVGDVSVYNKKQNKFQNRSVELKTSFGNETIFFANAEVNEYFETINDTDDNYEQLKELYLDGGLEDEGSPIDAFNLLMYKQTVFPKQQYAYLDETRSRKYYENLFWRDLRADRRRTNVDGGFGLIIASQSIWPLDAREDFASRTQPQRNYYQGVLITPPSNWSFFEYDIGGSGSFYDPTEVVQKSDNADSGPGVLQNRYSIFTLGGTYRDTNGYPYLNFDTSWPPATAFTASIDSVLSASCVYSRLHTLKNVYSPVNPSGIKIDTSAEFFADREDPVNFPFSNHTASIFNGTAVWDAGRQSGKAPFYDSYSKFSEDLRVKGKSFSKIPEFRISNHVEFYLENGVTQELPSIFEISGALSQNDTTENQSQFYKILSTADFLKHFDLVKSDHKDLANEKILTLKCKALKKFLPYTGFYPAERTVEISKQFRSSYIDNVDFSVENQASLLVTTIKDYDNFKIAPMLVPLFAPGILFNTIKSGVAVDFPLIFLDDFIRSNGAGDPDPGEAFTFNFANDKGRSWATSLGGYQDANNNALIGHTAKSSKFENYSSIYSKRIPFEALVEPENFLAFKELSLQEPHPFGLAPVEFRSRWDGSGSPLYKKMMSNFLAEVPEFFIQGQNFKTISSLEEQNPEFGNAISGNYYLMRVKMTKSRNKPNLMLNGYDGFNTIPPQDVTDLSGSPGSSPGTADDKFTVRETLTMYSRPTAFGPPTLSIDTFGSRNGITHRIGSTWGFNFPYTAPYYHGESWCDLIFKCKETRKYRLDEILSEVEEFPYYTRYWSPFFQDALRDLTGYRSGSFGSQSSINGPYKRYAPITGSGGEVINSGSAWAWMVEELRVKTGAPNEDHIGPYDVGVGWTTPTNFSGSDGETFWAKPETESTWLRHGPQSPHYLNYNAMQLDSSLNLFGKGTIREVNLDGDATDERMEVASDATVRGKTRWIIQPKFETPILNFNKYNNLENTNCTSPEFAKSQVPRGMWHQYGDLPKEDEGIYLQVEDISDEWLRTALRIERGNKRVRSLADLVGFSRDPVRLGEVANVKEISEAVVAVPFIEKNGTRQFFSIPRADIDSCVKATKREVGPGSFVAGGPPKAGDSVYQMVKNMQKYVFPPSMDFVRYKEIDPFAMYIFEFKHNLTKQDLADIWQNLSPEIGTRMEEAEASISHELLAHELLGGGAVVKNGTLDDNAEGNGIPSNIQWMVFKAKKRAKTNYFDKVVAKKGTTEDTSSKQLENASGQTGDDLGITYNWPYDFFSLVELVKLDAEVTFADIGNDDKGQKTIKKVEKKSFEERRKERRATRGFNFARGKGRPKK